MKRSKNGKLILTLRCLGRMTIIHVNLYSRLSEHPLRHNDRTKNVLIFVDINHVYKDSWSALEKLCW